MSKLPPGYHSIVPYLTVKNAVRAIEFYVQAFGAQERGRITMQGGSIGHAELLIGDAVIMLAEEMPAWGNVGPETLGGSAVGISVYVEEVDVVVEQALKAGAVLKRPLTDQFYGDRSATLIDPFGHIWTVATHMKDVSFEEMQKISDEMYAKQ